MGLLHPKANHFTKKRKDEGLAAKLDYSVMKIWNQNPIIAKKNEEVDSRDGS